MFLCISSHTCVWNPCTTSKSPESSSRTSEGSSRASEDYSCRSEDYSRTSEDILWSDLGLYSSSHRIPPCPLSLEKCYPAFVPGFRRAWQHLLRQTYNINIIYCMDQAGTKGYWRSASGPSMEPSYFRLSYATLWSLHRIYPTIIMSSKELPVVKMASFDSYSFKWHYTAEELTNLRSEIFHCNGRKRKHSCISTWVLLYFMQ